jgi:hypothetical protein
LKVLASVVREASVQICDWCLEHPTLNAKGEHEIGPTLKPYCTALRIRQLGGEEIRG